MAMSYNIQPEIVTVWSFIRTAIPGHDHDFNRPRVIWMHSPTPTNPNEMVRSPVLACSCGQMTSNCIPDSADRVRIGTWAPDEEEA